MKTYDLARLGLLALTLILTAGCGGGGLFHDIGYKDLPDEAISVEQLPADVRAKVDSHVAERSIKEVRKGVRRAHRGTWVYTVKFDDRDGSVLEVQFTAHGEQIYAGPERP